VAKLAGYTVYFGHPTLQRIESYRLSLRAEAVRRARASGAYERVPGAVDRAGGTR
jgi:hypothetical protein